MAKDLLDTLAEFKDGNPGGLEAYFNRFKRPLLYFAKSILKHHPEEAEEIVLDSFVKLWQQRNQFDSEDKLRAFLYIVTKNACLSYLNSSHARQHFDVELSEDLLMEDPESYAKLIRSEMLELVSREIQKLPDTQQKVIRLSHYENKSTAEISSALNMSQNTVYVNYSRGIATLKKAFRKKKDWLFSFLL